ncbi:ABC transporter permease [Paenibacillus dendritiformis]|uniref:Bacitracin transport permease bcrb n=1 Tax=Paenibacillus dendritiformis C454 TaxID=1131935 RepID=H3SDS1_9BACL|nr:ABC transporter permease [Paenibacillus dendritiformis]EHQ62758.1 bacitracin transport permease bcrb [Paenibacillus dendritiformis C454]CAH8767688.1 ABC transporter permease [Paenibacillus dendritiformis]
MRNLMRLEMKKYKIGGYIRGAVIASAIILLFMLFVSFVQKVDEGTPAFTSLLEAFDFGVTIVRGTFIVFAAVLLSRFVIEEFRSKSITVLFMYPINRKKLIAAKLAIVVVFTFCAIILSTLFVTSGYYLLNRWLDLVPGGLPLSALASQGLKAFINAIAASGMGLIPLFFGMRKHSVSATIVSSILMMAIITSSTNGFSLGSIIFIPLTLAVIGGLIAYFTIRNIEHVDVTT